MVALFGKLPLIGDFTRVRASGPGWAALETWLTQAVAWHESSRSANWHAVSVSPRPLGFVFRAPRAVKAAEVLVGVIWPSCDVVGRRFPFVAFSRLAERDVAREPHLLPPTLTPYFEALAACGAGLTALSSEAEIASHFLDVPEPKLASTELLSSYLNWTQATEWGELWTDLYGEPKEVDLHGVLSTVVEAVRPFQGQECPTTPLALRLPLGRARGVNASFWIDLVRSHARWKSTIPNMFWALDDPQSAMLLQLGDPHPSSLSELWFPDPDSDNVCDLVTPTAPFGPISVQVERIVQALSVSDALAAARG